MDFLNWRKVLGSVSLAVEKILSYLKYLNSSCLPLSFPFLFLEDVESDTIFVGFKSSWVACVVFDSALALKKSISVRL